MEVVRASILHGAGVEPACCIGTSSSDKGAFHLLQSKRIQILDAAPTPYSEPKAGFEPAT